MDNQKGIMIGENVELISMGGTRYALVFDAAAEGRESMTGKTVLVATTGRGFGLLGGNLAFNYYKPVAGKAPAATSAKPKTVLVKGKK